MEPAARLTPADFPWLAPRAAYVHVPFCAHHCGYCDFAVATGQDHRIELYLDALAAELAGLKNPHPVETIFLGGGTPTYLTPAQLARLLGEIRRWLPLVPPFSVEGETTGIFPPSPPRGEGADEPQSLSPQDRGNTPPEFSIESTPDSLDPERVAVLAEFGVTRVSVGVQSFHPHLLAALDRRHRREQIPRAVACVRERIPQLSLDLIFGVPGQTLAEWEADLDEALRYEPDHLSTYGLTYEKGTPLWKQRERGQVRPVGEEDELAMYRLAMDKLESAGFEQYEISNFARPGKRCRHNEVYWANEAYLGFGMGAARYVGGRRELNTRSLDGYIRKVLSGESPTFQSECLPPRERALETVAVQLRRAEGVGRGRFREQTGFDLDELAGERVREYVALGLLADDGERVRLTREGRCVADAVIAGLMR